jgi:site-specific recombinase
MPSTWDLTALINAADPAASTAERHLWVARLFEWLRSSPRGREAADAVDDGATPWPLRRLRLLVRQLEIQDELRERVRGVFGACWNDIDLAGLWADLGFAERPTLGGELLARLQARVLPSDPSTTDGPTLFALWLRPEDAAWLDELDDDLLDRLAALLPLRGSRDGLQDALMRLASHVQSAGHAPGLRQRMDAALLADDPFAALARDVDALRAAMASGDATEHARTANLLRARADACRAAADSVTAHLESEGVSVDIVHRQELLRLRCERIELLLDVLLAAHDAREWRRLVVELLAVLARRRGAGALLADHYRLLARRVADRSAETGEHYITRDRAEYRDMLRRAGGGGAVIAGTTFLKFAIAALGLSAFWGGVWAGVNYAASFVLVMLLHWTVATKQPAMTAPALAATVPPGGGSADAEAIEAFVDRVAQLIRSQVAGIIGNVALCVPLVLVVQVLGERFFGAPPIGADQAPYVLGSLTLLGPTALFAAFTGVLLFASSLVAGWAENWFVLHRLQQAIAWSPRTVAALGAARARRWALWWRANISGLAGNISLGLMLGLVPPLVAFVGVPLDVRHVTLASGQLAAASAALGSAVLAEPAFWWCVAGIACTGVLNVGVSFWLAFRVALQSRGVRVRERAGLNAAVRRRLARRPLDFLWPPREPASAQ